LLVSAGVNFSQDKNQGRENLKGNILKFLIEISKKFKNRIDFEQNSPVIPQPNLKKSIPFIKYRNQ